jgi:prepilin-type N-terminal cleavage/methylation domain-containing protein
MWDRMTEKRNEGGFTLIELLIVIIILAILAAIVVFAVGTTGSNAKTSACAADAKTFETALESYKAEVGAYPGLGDGTAAPTGSSGEFGLYGNPASALPNNEWKLPSGQVIGPFMRSKPGTTHYQVVTDGNGAVYVFPPITTPTASSVAVAAGAFTANGGNPRVQDVSVVPPGGAAPAAAGTDANAVNFDSDPSICADTNLVQ